MKYWILIIACTLFLSCRTSTNNNLPVVDPIGFEQSLDRKKVGLYTLKNDQGMTCQITNFGGRVVSLFVRDKNGQFIDIVLGYDNLNGYVNSNEPYFGALIGRYGNRIAKGKFSIDSTEYTLATNNGINHLHGGPKGFHNVVWDVTEIAKNKIVLSYTSVDGEEGYPGNLNGKVIYILSNNNELKIEYEAETDKSTPINLSHHSFFNLHGVKEESINSHILQISAAHFTPIDDGLIPTGEIKSVDGSPFDFQKPHTIGERVNANTEQIKFGYGYDHNFVLDGKGMRKVAHVYEETTGISMEVHTDEPGLQFYGGNFLNGKDAGKKQYSL